MKIVLKQLRVSIKRNVATELNEKWPRFKKRSVGHSYTQKAQQSFFIVCLNIDIVATTTARHTKIYVNNAYFVFEKCRENRGTTAKKYEYMPRM